MRGNLLQPSSVYYCSFRVGGRAVKVKLRARQLEGDDSCRISRPAATGPSAARPAATGPTAAVHAATTTWSPPPSTPAGPPPGPPPLSPQYTPQPGSAQGPPLSGQLSPDPSPGAWPANEPGPPAPSNLARVSVPAGCGPAGSIVRYRTGIKRGRGEVSLVNLSSCF